MAASAPNKVLVLVGGGGHCHSCLDVLRTLEPGIQVRGILDPQGQPGNLVMGVEVLGDDSKMAELAQEGAEFLITLGQVGSCHGRRRLYQLCLQEGGRLSALAAVDAIVAPTAELGAGTIVMHQALVNAQARIGVNCIINSRALVEHDAVVGDHCHIATGAIVNGGCSVGAGSLIGSGAILREGVRVGSQTIVGAGSVVTKDLNLPGVYCGTPARLLRALAEL